MDSDDLEHGIHEYIETKIVDGKIQWSPELDCLRVNEHVPDHLWNSKYFRITDDPSCHATCNHFVCTRPRGHDGPHVATVGLPSYISRGLVKAVWEQG